ncbi:hypothetical protein LCGC14_2853510 [marine sediment metagenome]|uniref:HNH nuclease domain-containing protein n=1 Tax=marine sediment metagenome TaxID=412755 RepID=A0A0F9AG23_9ZZZZ
MNIKHTNINATVLHNLYWDQGLTQEQIGNRHGVPRGSMPHLFKRYDVKVRDTFKAKNLSLSRLKELYIDEGMPVYKVAKTLNVSASCVKRYLIKYNIKIRSGHTYKILILPIDDIVRMYTKEDFSAATIAKIYNVSIGVIIKRLKAEGIEILYGTHVFVNCPTCKKHFDIERRTFRKRRKKRPDCSFFCSPGCLSVWRKKVYKGEKSPTWQGGKTYEPYGEVWLDREFKEDIKERDDYQCQNPDCWGNSHRICLHHIDYNKENCIPSNLITLCGSCNARANVDRDRWQVWYGYLLDEKLCQDTKEAVIQQTQ